ncbi:hypothetical protein H4R24_003709 [Coemansia sp. RSA 988]|nr:hypothetical protein H4R24_003709 [Coemansia sp. RSA 988]
MDSLLPTRKQGGPPERPKAASQLSLQQMAKRLHTRLRQARVAIERDLGHSLTAIVPQPAAVTRAPARRSSALGGRAHSYSLGDFPTLASEPASPGGRSGTRATALQRHWSALPLSAARHSVQPQTQAQPIAIPRLPRLPGSPRTPQLQPQDSENEIAHTILMLSTPPAARAASLSESPCQRPLRIGGQGTAKSRRLSFSRCNSSAERPAKRLRGTEPVQSEGMHMCLDTPNLSQVAALSSRPTAATRRRSPACSAGAGMQQQPKPPNYCDVQKY